MKPGDLLQMARPVQVITVSPENHEPFSFVAARAIVEGNFLLLLDEEGIEAERYNMLSPSFESLEWLDIEKRVTFTRYSYGKIRKEYEHIFYGSPKYRYLKYKEIGGIEYNTLRPECEKCDLHGVLEDAGCDSICPGCPCPETRSCDDCMRDLNCSCPRHPLYETAEYAKEGL